MVTSVQVVSGTIFRTRRTTTESASRMRRRLRRNSGAIMNRRKLQWLVVVPLALHVTAALVSSAEGTPLSSTSNRPELEYLKAVNQVAPPGDPQLLFLLMGQYASANRHAEGVEFFSTRLREFSPRLTDVQKSLYLSVIGLLRAQ